jgi:hypothetical protein
MRTLTRLFLAALLAPAALASAADIRTDPPPGSGPVIVRAGFMLYDVNEVEETTETFEFEGALFLNWHDPRQAFDPTSEGVAERVFKGDYQFAELFNGWWPQVTLANQSGARDRQGVVLRIEPDGTVWYVEEFDAVAESAMELGFFPFDSQSLEIHFKFLGYAADEVRFAPVAEYSGLVAQRGNAIGNAEWHVDGFTVSAEMDRFAIARPSAVGEGSTLRVDVVAKRKPGYLIRTVVLPLALIVMLSWSIFWMDRESLGNRMDISFIALLTVVAFQTVVEQTLPAIPGFTLMAGFLTINYLLLAATIVVNLRVDFLDRSGRREVGDLLDYRCRWIFPAIYFAALPLLLALFAALRQAG